MGNAILNVQYVLHFVKHMYIGEESAPPVSKIA